MTAAVGPNGAGKSTLVTCVARCAATWGGELRRAGATTCAARSATCRDSLGDAPDRLERRVWSPVARHDPAMSRADTTRLERL